MDDVCPTLSIVERKLLVSFDIDLPKFNMGTPNKSWFSKRNLQISRVPLSGESCETLGGYPLLLYGLMVLQHSNKSPKVITPRSKNPTRNPKDLAKMYKVGVFERIVIKWSDLNDLYTLAENRWVFRGLKPDPTYRSCFTPVIAGDRAHLVAWLCCATTLGHL